MNRIRLKRQRRIRRKRGIRHRVLGMPDRPRLTVFRSAKHMYAQVIDDLSGRTIASASTVEKGDKQDNGGNAVAAEHIGKKIADRAKEAGIQRVIFDRNGFKYHGRVRALAEAARKGGLEF